MAKKIFLIFLTVLVGLNTSFLITNAAPNFASGLTVSSGNLGIGTTAPAYKLDVTGGLMRQSGYLVGDAATDNLLVNGDFEMGDVYGWTGWGVRGTVVTGGYSGNYALRLQGGTDILTDDYIPVDPTKDIFQLDAWVKKTVAGGTPGVLYFGYVAYDANKTGIYTAPCGTYCYFAASGYVIPVDGNWHKISATTVGEGTSFPNFPVGTKYVRIQGLVNYGGSSDAVTLLDHVTVRRLTKGPLIAGNNFSGTNWTDQNQYSSLYTNASNHLIISSPGYIGLNTAAPQYTLDVNGAATFNNNQIHGVGTPTASADAATKGYVDSIANPGSGQAGYWTLSGANVYPNSTAYNVGIGTASPGSKLDVAEGIIKASGSTSYGHGILMDRGSAITTSGLQTSIFNEWNGLSNAESLTSRAYSYKWQKDDGTNWMVLNSGGNLGIGTTNPQGKLDVQLAAGGGPGIRLINTSVNQGWMWYPVTNGVNTDMRLYEYNTNGNSDRVTFQAGGNIGINNASPVYKLDVVGNGAFRNGDNSYLYFGPNSSWGGSLYVGATPTKAGLATASMVATDGNLHIDAGTNNHIYLGYYSTNNLVGIGKGPGYKLDVNGAGSFNGYQVHSVGTPTVAADAATKGYVDSAVSGAANYWTPNGTHIYNNNSGNVGIGTTAPGAKLWIEGVNDLLNLKMTSGGYNAITLSTTFSGGNNYAINPYITGVSNGGFSLYDITNSVNRFVIQATTGNVGINTVSPEAKVHIRTGDSVLQNSLILQTSTGAGGDVNGNSISWKLGVEGTNAYEASYIRTTLPSGYGGTLTLGTNDDQTGGAIERIRIDKTGNVGIGATNLLKKLHIETYGTGSGGLGIYGHDGATQHLRAELLFDSWSGIMNLYEGSSVNTVSLKATGASWLNGGNVGIGISTPNYKLDVQGGNFNVSGTARIGGNAITFGDGTSITTDSSNRINLNASSYTYIPQGVFYVQNISHFRGGIDNDAAPYLTINGGYSGHTYFAGNVGINKTGPVYKLDVVGEGNFGGYQVHSVGTPTVAADAATKGYVDSAVSGAANYWSVNGAQIYNNNSGNVGIGTNSPNGKLHVSLADQDSNPVLIVRNNTTYTYKPALSLTATGGVDWTYRSLNFQVVKADVHGTAHSIISNGYLNWNAGNLKITHSAYQTAGGLYWPGDGSTKIVSGTSAGQGNPGGEFDVREIAIFNQTGNVGIGMNPSYKLDVNGQIRTGNAVSTWGDLITGTIDSNIVYAYNSVCVNNNSGSCNSSGGVVLGIDNDAVQANFPSSGSAYVNNPAAGAGNFGVGVTNPAEKLDVAGSIRSLGNWSSIKIGRSAVEGSLNVAVNAGDYQTGSQAGDTVLRSESASNRLMLGSGGNMGVVAYGANVGIGVASPAAKLEVGGSVRIPQGSSIEFSNVNADILNPGGFDLAFRTYPGSGAVLTEKMRITSAGNIGIGATNPSYRLHAYTAGLNMVTSEGAGGSDYVEGAFLAKSVNANRGAGLFTTGSSGHTWFVGEPYSSGGKFIIGHNTVWATSVADFSKAAMTIDVNNNVGIGTASPTYNLHVVGSGYFSGALTAASLSGTFTGTVPAANVSAGTFGSGVGGGSYRFPGNIYTDQNYGYGLVGVYSDVRYQGVFAMGDSYKLPADGTTPGTLYGIAWTHSNIGGQSKAGLGHQALFMTNGSTQTAIGTGIWTAGAVYAGSNITSSGYVSATSVYTQAANGSGIKFWGGSDSYRITMGNTSEDHYGPVTDYSIKTVIDSNGNTRGFTWGQNGTTPVAALNVGTGNMQIAGTFAAMGNVGVGTSAPAYSVEATGVIMSRTGMLAPAYVYSSDVSLKKNIKTIDSPLAKVLALRGVTFNWKQDNKPGLGFIAQEVEKVFPELVSSDAEGLKAVQYGNLVAPLVEAIKEQQKEIDNLEARLRILEKKKK